MVQPVMSWWNGPGKVGMDTKIKNLYLRLIQFISRCHDSMPTARREEVMYMKTRFLMPVPFAPCSQIDQTDPGIGFLTLSSLGSMHQSAGMAAEVLRSSMTTRSGSAIGKCALLVWTPTGHRKQGLTWVCMT